MTQNYITQFTKLSFNSINLSYYKKRIYIIIYEYKYE